MAKRLTGKVDNQTAVIEGVEKRTGEFDIKVKDDEGNVVFEQEKVPFEFDFCSNLAATLRYLGASLSADQATFLDEAVNGEGSKAAVEKLVKIVNDDLEAKAQRNAYSKLYQEKKPRSEESVTNTWALMVRGFVANTPGTTVQSAIDMFKTAVPNFPSDFTVEKYNAAKLPGRKSGN